MITYKDYIIYKHYINLVHDIDKNEIYPIEVIYKNDYKIDKELLKSTSNILMKMKYNNSNDREYLGFKKKMKEIFDIEIDYENIDYKLQNEINKIIGFKNDT